MMSNGVLLHDAAVAHDDHAVREPQRLVDVVRDEHDGLVQFLMNPPQLVLQPQARDRIEGPKRFVHQHDPRISGERPGQPDPLLLPAGELAGIAPAIGARQRHEVQQLVDAGLDAVVGPMEQLWDGGNVLLDPLVGKQTDLLNHVPDAPPQLCGRPRPDVDTID